VGTEHTRLSLGIKTLSSVTWDIEDVDAIVYCDVSMDGLAFWYPEHSTAFFGSIPDETECDIIFHFEVLAVAGACDNLHKTMEHCTKIIIHTDSMNTINIFNSLRCQPEFNTLLRHCIDIFIKKDFHVRVAACPRQMEQCS